MSEQTIETNKPDVYTAAEQEIVSAVMQYRYALSRSSGVSSSKDRLKNILFTNRDSIMRSFSEIGRLRKELDAAYAKEKMLSDALDESDDENTSLKKKIKNLEEEKQSSGKTSSAKSSKAKTAGKEKTADE